jgi:hypothetical protein
MSDERARMEFEAWIKEWGPDFLLGRNPVDNEFDDYAFDTEKRERIMSGGRDRAAIISEVCLRQMDQGLVVGDC